MLRSEGDKSLKNPVTPSGIDPGTVRLVAQHLNHYATPDPSHKCVIGDKCLRRGSGRNINHEYNLCVTEMDAMIGQ